MYVFPSSDCSFHPEWMSRYTACCSTHWEDLPSTVHRAPLNEAVMYSSSIFSFTRVPSQSIHKPNSLLLPLLQMFLQNPLKDIRASQGRSPGATVVGDRGSTCSWSIQIPTRPCQALLMFHPSCSIDSYWTSLTSWFGGYDRTQLKMRSLGYRVT